MTSTTWQPLKSFSMIWKYKSLFRYVISARNNILVRNSSSKELKQFVDFKRVRVSGGDGGNGCLSFLRLPFNEWAGPDGGNGGNGGHVIFEANTSVKDLRQVKSQYTSEGGINGHNKHCHGKNANHLYIKVPVGTLFRSENHTLIADLEKPGEIFVAARGGTGGKGNHAFLCNENRAPTMYEKGALGEQSLIYVELRVVAHIGLVGFPNAGKSSLLRAISAARPKIAAYPFTTLNPHVGIVKYSNYKQVSVADIPGLVRGAHRNYGLGFSFLRHVQRCSCLLYVLDLGVDSPWDQFEALQQELELYEVGLSEKPHAIIANKIDLMENEEQLTKLASHMSLPIIAISAKYGTNIQKLLKHIEELYDNTAQSRDIIGNRQKIT